MRPIHFAADRGHTELVEMLISNGVDFNVKDDVGMTPLMFAASCDNLV